MVTWKIIKVIINLSFLVVHDYLLKFDTNFYYFIFRLEAVSFLFHLHFSESSVMLHFYIEFQQNNAMCFMHSSLSLIVLEEYKSTCPEGKRYLFYRNTLVISKIHSLGRKICCRRDRNIKMSWRYICHHIQWETEQRLSLIELETLL